MIIFQYIYQIMKFVINCQNYDQFNVKKRFQRLQNSFYIIIYVKISIFFLKNKIFLVMSNFFQIFQNYE